MQINLDHTIVHFMKQNASKTARQFFRVGGASGTITKAMSAYDKVLVISTGRGWQRYVTHNRLVKIFESRNFW